MTTALCLNCGETKFGAWCPCRKCGVASSGDRNLDILFSDHQMSVATLQRFGGLIKQLNARCVDPDVRFWAIISYLSDHPAQLLTASPPLELADRVANLLTDVNLPIIAVDLKQLPEDTGPPQKTIAIPVRLLQAYLKSNEFFAISRVQVRKKNRQIVSGVLTELDGIHEFTFDANFELTADDIIAIRTAPGCLIGWWLQPKWSHAGGTEP